MNCEQKVMRSFVCPFHRKNLNGSREKADSRRRWGRNKSLAECSERESEWKWKGSDFPQLYFILRISSRTVGCLSVAGELVTLCTVHNMKLAKLTPKLLAVNARESSHAAFTRISGFILEKKKESREERIIKIKLADRAIKSLDHRRNQVAARNLATGILDFYSRNFFLPVKSWHADTDYVNCSISGTENFLSSLDAMFYLFYGFIRAR